MYKHNDLLEALAEVGLTNDKPWEEFEWKNRHGDWFPPGSIDFFLVWARQGVKWRRKPKEEQ